MEGIARETSKRGATMMNIMPLIPAHNIAYKRFRRAKNWVTRATTNKYLAQLRVCKQCMAAREAFQGVSEAIKTFNDNTPVGSFAMPNSA